MAQVPWARFGVRGGVVLLLVLPALAGCGKRTGFVSGKVTYQGRPLTSGSVTFHGADGRTDSGSITPEGNYTVPQAPVGTAKVTVLVRPSRPGRLPQEGPAKETPKHPGEGKAGKHPSAGPAAQAGRPQVIPKKYEDPNQSGLTFTVTTGKQTIDIPLE
jgi:hypothetical protein